MSKLVYRILVSALITTVSNFAIADWTGVNVNLEDTTSHWDADGVEREASLNRISLQLEEKTEAELRVGVTIGQMSIRTNDVDGPSNIQKFEASFLGLNLRQPFQFGEHFSLEGNLAYRYHTGTGNSDTDPEEISWHETQLTLAFGAQIGPIRIRPFVSWQKLDGDIEAESGRQIFEADNPVTRGIQLDYFVEPYAYLRFTVSDGNDETLSLRFARAY